MLFNSTIFIFVFLPLTLICFYQIGRRRSAQAAIVWLVAASLFFYGWGNPKYLGLIVGSMWFNYAWSMALVSPKISARSKRRKGLLALGVAVNLLILGYFKYANFFVDNLNQSFHTQFHLKTIILPLAISFFTFQQIAYLVDTYRLETRKYDFLKYCLFVVFFPHLIAGPITYHKEILPQFLTKTISRFQSRNLAVGLTIFSFGLFKKAMIADHISHYGNLVFAAAAKGEVLSFLEAWSGALGYTFQLYFDFSGYSDMAIGLACMFGILLPFNFHSPYKAASIIDFWYRWHMTLSRFLRSYIYIPLGGNRRGEVRRYLNIMITMLLGGFWHGAGWTFVLWRGLHGLYLCVNHLWRKMKEKVICVSWRGSCLGLWVSRMITFFAVVFAWVFFRANDLSSAVVITKGMLGINGIMVWETYFEKLNRMGGLGERLAGMGVVFGEPKCFLGLEQIFILTVLLLWVVLMPNTQQFMARYRPGIDIYNGPTDIRRDSVPFYWKPSAFWGRSCLRSVSSI